MSKKKKMMAGTFVRENKTNFVNAFLNAVWEELGKAITLGAKPRGSAI